MIFKTISAKQFSQKLSARIQKTGRLGFGENEKITMDLSTDTYIKFVSADEKEPFTHIVVLRQPDADAFRMRLSGQYLYLDTVHMFDFYDINYSQKTLFLDFIRDASLDDDPALGGEVYKVKFREKRRKPEEVEESADSGD